MKTIQCEVCGSGFLVKPYREKTARFCSFRCAGVWHATSRKLWLSAPPPPSRVGCAPANKGKPSPTRGSVIKPRQSFACTLCGKMFSPPLWMVRQNASASGKRFCSKRCHGQYKRKFESGEHAPDWVGGPATYRGRGWINARKVAVTRDGGTCQGCGKHIGDSIPVHHICPFREFQTADQANRPDNLICLCQPCHMKAETTQVAAPLVAGDPS